MRITVDDLRALDACEEGVEAFRTVCGESVEGEWTQAAQFFALGTPLARFLGWAWLVGVIPQWSMCGANLRRADLYSANLYGADLRRVDLNRADLRRADLRRADLYSANMTRASLRGADLRAADLRGADLYGADLRGADLRGADLTSHDLDNLRQRGAIV